MCSQGVSPSSCACSAQIWSDSLGHRVGARAPESLGVDPTQAGGPLLLGLSQPEMFDAKNTSPVVPMFRLDLEKVPLLDTGWLLEGTVSVHIGKAF